MQDSRVEGSQGLGSIKSRYVAGSLIFYTSAGVELFRINPAITGGYIVPGEIRSLRTRFSTAQINAGATILAALAGFKYRMLSCLAIAIGGNAATVTSVDVKGVQSASAVVLVSFLQASLTRSTVLTSGGTGATVLADGASHVQNDANTAITIIKAGSDLATATAVDIIFNYTIEP